MYNVTWKTSYLHRARLCYGFIEASTTPSPPGCGFYTGKTVNLFTEAGIFQQVWLAEMVINCMDLRCRRGRFTAPMR